MVRLEAITIKSGKSSRSLPIPRVVSTFCLSSRSDSSCRDKRRGIPFSSTGYCSSASRFPFGSSSTYLRVLIHSAIPLACSSFSPAMPLLCGALLPDSPLVMCSTI